MKGLPSVIFVSYVPGMEVTGVFLGDEVKVDEGGRLHVSGFIDWLLQVDHPQIQFAAVVLLRNSDGMPGTVDARVTLPDGTIRTLLAGHVVDQATRNGYLIIRIPSPELSPQIGTVRLEVEGDAGSPSWVDLEVRSPLG